MRPKDVAGNILKKLKPRIPHLDRISLIKGGVFFLTAIVILRLFNLQVLSYEDYKAAADGEHLFFQKLFPKRGDIYLHEKGSDFKEEPFLIEIGGEKLFPAVTDREYQLVYGVPNVIVDPERTAEKIAPIIYEEPELEEILEMIPQEVDEEGNPKPPSEEKIKEKKDELYKEFVHGLHLKLAKERDSYEPLKKKLTDEQVEQIKELDLYGIHFAPETYRYYPERELGGQLFGFLGQTKDGVKGLYGLEGYFNDILKGKEGSLKFETDVWGALIPTGERQVEEAVNGSSLVLTIDRVAQMTVCKKLSAWVEEYEAAGGTVVVMEPQTGALIATCSVPDFDPAKYGEYELSTYNNPAIFTPYEPGSIFKPIVMSMALDMGRVVPETTYEDTGEVKIGVHTIRNSDLASHGVQTMTDVLNKSLNTGMVFIGDLVGRDKFKRYLQEYGFGAPSGIRMDTEVGGNIASLDQRGDIYLATASFGQGVTMTPLQLTTAYAAIANGGKLVQPYVVDEIIKDDGTVIKTEPKVIRRVISERAAALLSGMLVTVVRKGHGIKAQVPGYYVAGKTGTAQVPKANGGGYEPASVVIGSFAGFAPVDNPKFVMLIKIDRPKGGQWAANSAAPLFGDLADFLLHYYEIPYDEPSELDQAP